MRSGAAQGHLGYFHEAALYESDEQLLEIVVPFVEGGLDAAEPTLVTFDGRTAEIVRAALSHREGITFLPPGHYANPAQVILRYRKLVAAHVAAGAAQIRVVGEVPHPGLGADWDQWARYEAAINLAYHDLPVWGLCPYDLRIIPAFVIDDVLRTHPHLAHPDSGHERNLRFEDPAVFLRMRENTVRGPPEERAADVALDAPSPAAARRAAHAVASTVGLAPSAIEKLVLAVSETVANALDYGRPPVRVRLWGEHDRVVAAISDGGDGPMDPFVGLLPPRPNAPRGRGLWIVHQLCQHVTMSRSSDGFTVHLVAEDPRIAA